MGVAFNACYRPSSYFSLFSYFVFSILVYLCFLYFFTINLSSVTWTCPWRTRWWPWAWRTRLLRQRPLAGTGEGILSLSLSGGPGAIWENSRSRPIASGTPGSYSDSVRRAGGYVSASDRGTGTSGGHFGAPTRWSEGPCWSSQDEWCQCSTPHGSPPNASFAQPAPREFAAGIPCPLLSSRPL